MSPEQIARHERNRRRRIIVGAVIAVIGIVGFGAGSLLNKGTSNGVNEKLQQALVLQNSGQLDAAASLYREVIDEDPKSPVAFFNLGVIEHTEGRTKEAAADYTEVLSLDPRYMPALFNLAILRAEEGDTTSAISLYRRVIAVNPDQASALLNLGILLLQDGQEAEASELINRAIVLNPSLAGSDAPAGGPPGSTPPP